MNLKETIKRVLKEQTDLPLFIRRRGFDLKINSKSMKSFALSNYDRVGDIDEAVDSAADYVAHDIVPWADEYGEEYPDYEYDNWRDIMRHYLYNKFGDETREYLKKALPDSSFKDDGFNYYLIRTDNKDGMFGNINIYRTWAELIQNWTFPIDWWEVKSKLDKDEKILLLKPSDENNRYDNLYFFIQKDKR